MTAFEYSILNYIYFLAPIINVFLGALLLFFELLLGIKARKKLVIWRSATRLIWGSLVLVTGFNWAHVNIQFIMFVGRLFWNLSYSYDRVQTIFIVLVFLCHLSTFLIIVRQIISLWRFSVMNQQQLSQSPRSLKKPKMVQIKKEQNLATPQSLHYFSQEEVLASFDELLTVVGTSPSAVYYRTNVETMTDYLPKIQANLDRLFQSGQAERFDKSLVELQEIVSGIKQVSSRLKDNPDLDLIADVNDLRYCLQRLT